MTLDFALTWDYRCPFARNFHEHVLTGLAAGADWEVHFVPFSLDQVHVEEGQPDAWDNPDTCRSLLAGQVGVAVRDHWPEHFLAAHQALFSCRHEHGGDLRDEKVLRAALGSAAGLDVDAVFAEVAAGWPLETFRKEHEAAVADYNVFGVPTVIVGDHAVFVRVMNRPRGDADLARRTVERTVDLLTGWPELNEFKHTSIPR